MAPTGSDSLRGDSCWDGFAASAAVWEFATIPMSNTSKANREETLNFIMILDRQCATQQWIYGFQIRTHTLNITANKLQLILVAAQFVAKGHHLL
jgi:hypothetical protein